MMSSRLRSLARLRYVFAMAVPLCAAACASREDAAGGEVVACEPSGETTLAPRARAGGGWDANGIAVNGVRLGGWDANGRSLNGVLMRGGWDGNGTTLSGVTVSGFASAPNDALVGTTLTGVLDDGSTVDLVVAAYERGGETDSPIARYRVELDGTNICPDGESGIFVPGVWDATAARHDSLSVGGRTVTTSFSCARGAIAKCVSWGYAPWTQGAAIHQACTRMTRADYCGTGDSFTRDGTLIDIFDTRGVQAPSEHAELEFEAAWGPNGAVCARRPRFDDRSASGEKILPSCWTTLPRCTSLEEARSYGAEIANASRLELRTLCR